MLAIIVMLPAYDTITVLQAFTADVLSAANVLSALYRGAMQRAGLKVPRRHVQVMRVKASAGITTTITREPGAAKIASTPPSTPTPSAAK